MGCYPPVTERHLIYALKIHPPALRRPRWYIGRTNGSLSARLQRHRAAWAAGDSARSSYSYRDLATRYPLDGSWDLEIYGLAEVPGDVFAAEAAESKMIRMWMSSGNMVLNEASNRGVPVIAIPPGGDPVVYDSQIACARALSEAMGVSIGNESIRKACCHGNPIRSGVLKGYVISRCLSETP